ncbi:MAG TPA: multicopper oxidase domain-containing protein [Dermatophilaceae bacterium]|nr:multicopper oxidase domain-containing protein [Dermatophilaceae bacterium]
MTSSRTAAGARRPLVGDLALASSTGLASVFALAWLSLLSAGDPAGPAAVLTGALAVAGFVLPMVLVVTASTLVWLRQRGRLAWTAAFVLAPAAAAAASAGNQLRLVFFDAAPTAQRVLPVVGFVGDALTLLALTLPLCALGIAAQQTHWRRLGARRRTVLVAGVATALVAGPAAAMTAVAAPSPATQSCLNGGPVDTSFDVTSLDVNIPLNRFGDHDPKGKMYALTNRVSAVRSQETSQKVSIGLRNDAIQPLVIRANQGDCVEIRYTNNATGGDFGMHIDGLEFAVTSSGDRVGTNSSSAPATGGSTTYRFFVPDDPTLEGGHYIHPGPGYRAAVDHGLFGALVVEPPGSTYWDATNAGQRLESGWEAIIKPGPVSGDCVVRSSTPTCGFRENALLHHEVGNDNELLKDKNNLNIPLVDDTTGSYRPGGFALNYRSEPFRNRLLAYPKEKSHAYSSYTFGEPATPMMRGYLADPTKIRLMHVGAEKFHVYHLHGGGDRWRFNPVADTTYNYAETGLHKDSDTIASPSQRLDSQSIGPGESYNLELEGGAGGVQQSAGDFLFHCHIAKHYTSGMWSLWRVYDTLQPDLVPIGDRPAPPAAVDSRALIGRTFNGTTITAANLDDWIRPQLPPSGIPKNGQDPTVWNWKTTGTASNRLYLGAPADGLVFPDSVQAVPGQPNLLPVDVGHIVGTGTKARPAILFNPRNGRPAYPLFRSSIGKRPPFTPAGHTGAPWLGANVQQLPQNSADPWAGRDDGLCPQGRTQRRFNVVAIAKKVQRTPSVVDAQGKLFVLAKDKAASYADPAKSDPLAIRANQGDCVAITLTNEMPDAAAFDKFSKTSMHIHHVQFDVQGSDGVTAGYAFEHSVRPYQAVDAKLVAAAQTGDTTLRLSSVAKLVGKDANGKPTRPWIAVGQGLESIEAHQVISVDTTTNTVTLADAVIKDHDAGEYAGVEFIQYRWYPDVTLDNVFWHDHVDGIHGWGHGLVGQLIVEPAGSTYHDPVTGAEVDSGTLVDVHTSNPLAPGVVDGSFRELALWTINDNDQGAYSTLNLKANPLATRLDKANRFSSWKYGDPMTPLPRLYPDDPLVVRTINVSPTVDSLHLQGGRTLLEPRYTHTSGGVTKATGTLLDTIHAGVSEKFTLVFNGNDPDLRMRPGDYLYAQGGEQRTQQGAWGVVRILPGRTDTLKPLPGLSAPSTAYVEPTPTGAAPPAAAGPGNPCPAGAPTRRFQVTAMDRSGGLSGGRTAFVPNQDVNAVKQRLKNPEPLVLHVVEGECVTVNVTNALLAPVSFSVGKLDRDEGSGGVNVGFAPDQNVVPGASRDYVYYASSERLGTAPIADLAGATTLKNGLYGAVVVAPKSQVDGLPTEFSDPVTGAARDIGAQVLVHVPGAAVQDYRDYTVTMADDDIAIGRDFMPYPTDANAGRSVVNYQAAPIGDGATAFTNPGSVPMLKAYAGDPMLVHVLAAPGSENAHVFGLGGLRWSQDRFETETNAVTAQAIMTWETFDLKVAGGAGGTQQQPGDYFYGDMRRPFTAVGMWGLQRVLPANPTTCPFRKVDGSTC